LAARFTERHEVFLHRTALAGSVTNACSPRNQIPRSPAVHPRSTVFASFPEVPAAVCRRIIIGQACYAFGALLCFFSTYLSMLFIVSVQLFYILSPWLPARSSENSFSPLKKS
jgi:hypothetical protein